MRILLLLASPAIAALILPASAAISIDYVTVGNTGNAADTTGYGGVDQEYRIGKYEVTNGQYAEFLNAKGTSNPNGIYNADMAGTGITQSGVAGSFTYNVTTGSENKPVVYVSWFDAARFTNWLGNGQGSGNMEDGGYTLSNATDGIISVNSGATIYLPSENEWYKAAYFNGDTSSYSDYPNGQNSITTDDANYSSGVSTNVGTYSSDPSSFGTFDQGGNVWEWNDAATSDTFKGVRGGSWDDSSITLSSSVRFEYTPTVEAEFLGFRVASSSVPEPSSILLTMIASGVLFMRRNRLGHIATHE